MKTRGKPDNLTQMRRGVICHCSTTPIPILIHNAWLHRYFPDSWRIGKHITSGICREFRIIEKKLIHVLREVGLARGKIAGMT